MGPLNNQCHIDGIFNQLVLEIDQVKVNASASGALQKLQASKPDITRQNMTNLMLAGSTFLLLW